jgi:hypothetical protein
MAGALIVALVAAAALVWIVLYVVRQQAAEREQIDKRLHDENTPTLEYDVPTGQDPAVLLAALERAGYIASTDSRPTHHVVMVLCPDGVERERGNVRSVIESASVTSREDGVPLQVEVRFRDE